MKTQKIKSDERLHIKLRAILVRKIFDGMYRDGDLIPTERDLAEKYQMSRVTVRSALAALEHDGIVTRRQGHGTRVTLHSRGNACDQSLIAVLAPSESPFFASFLRTFEAAAEQHDALVVFKAAGKHPVTEDLFRCYERGIRNAVIWPYDETIDSEALTRLRGLGMNMVLFDRVMRSAAVDCVSVDNTHAITALTAYLTGNGAGNIAYIGWENSVISSNTEREAAFMRTGTTVFRLPWNRERDIDAAAAKLFNELPSKTDAVICGNGVIGIALKRHCIEKKSAIDVVCIDDLPGAEALGLTVYEQPMEALAMTVYERLMQQNSKADEWKADVIYRKGNVLTRTPGKT
ncbi:MAG: GntR family transcriptional regulator [Spirochaetes bacterium]|nr:GntR family transcriptional regulator [Spirochaetota bacterium]